MLTSYAEDELLFEAISAGAAGYVLKQGGGDELIRAIKRVAQGEALLDPAVTQRVLARVRLANRQQKAAAFSELTEQELRVLGLVSEGCTNKQIAKNLFLGEGTQRVFERSSRNCLTKDNRQSRRLPAFPRTIPWLALLANRFATIIDDQQQDQDHTLHDITHGLG
jgi:DNA-binding NarL/FixJ family response regulator